ncbi:MAG: LuxR C-terminal-related transcriptional regulator [Pseudomonadota bacterium]
MSETIAAFDPALSFEAMEAAAQPGFDDWLLSAAQRFAAVEEVYAYRYTDTGGPRALVSTGEDAASRRAALYASRFHPYDPMLASPLRRSDAAFFRVEAAQIDNSEYRQVCFEAPRFVDKLSFRWRRRQDNGQAEAYYVSFYRRRAGARDKLQALATLAEVGLISLARKQQSARPAQPLVCRLESQLRQAYPALTPREVTVCARTLAGQSSGEISNDLSIARASVLTYRQRAYGKYMLTSAAGFLERIVG